jgi:alpha-ketoglutarate-dependent taurine dioxygenase
MRATDSWIQQWPPQALAEIEGAASRLKALGKHAPRFDKSDFPLPTVSSVLEEMIRQVTLERGFVLLRGLPVARYDDRTIRDIFWGLGCHWGRPVTQNVAGDAIATITDHGLDADKPGVKPSMTNARQRPHSDPSDVVALLCVRGAAAGGASRIASSMAIYNRLLDEYPDGLECLHRGFHHDLRGDETPEAPYGCTPVPIPVYRWYQGVLSCVFNASSAKQAQLRMGVFLPEREMAMLDRIVELAESEQFRLEMVFEPGDIQLLNNHTIVHWRTEYADHPESERKRRLYRLWLDRPGERPVDPAMRRGYITGSKAGLPVLD